MNPFTTGPWRLEKLRAPNDSAYYRIFDERRRDDVVAQPIAQVFRESDATLISEAPALAAALEAAKVALTFFLEEDHSDCMKRGGCPAYHRGIAAALAARDAAADVLVNAVGEG